VNGLFIGRFQPFHLGHLDAITKVFLDVENLWIGIGSSNRSHEKKNPFTAEERKEMILSSIDTSLLQKIKIFFIPDVDDHEKWTHQVDSIVPKYDVVFSNDDFTISLFSKRGIKVIQPHLKHREDLSGTNIRNKMINGQNWKSLVTKGTKTVIKKIDGISRLSDL